ncbi:ABC-type Fe3+-hydroxamate transport system, periplasmic component [Frankia torreyi]|uniref:ABC-type Fe3+-hydroxamate transport system, periplasmic component n=3 Tax=Frankia TaxID=1854 RepID=A0A0D8BC08_9ACTN|nr:MULTISPECIES: ABC transporter substrate-binding protein [Frankia]KJE21625.1 ABC-type Fe3+-hydroxamate transport system, periplasmic component [Frankia torreyi]KQM03684.1 ABC-type Fe3+-hydroxamate transport system, periplasmic component [Frankia sp. CpI1-P]
MFRPAASRQALALGVAAAVAALAAGCGSSSSDASPPAPTTQVVTSMTGEKTTVPLKIDRIAEQFPAHTVTDIMLGVGDKLVAIPQNVKTIPFLRKVYPGVNDLPELFRNGGKVNMEELLKLKPDVVSTISGGDTMTPFTQAGLPAVNMAFNTFPELAPSIQLAGKVYGGAAAAKAKEFSDYVNAKLAMVQSRLAKLPATEKPSVVHIASYPPVVVDGGKSLIDGWINIAGGTDSASGVKGTHVTVSMEQLLQWNPDVLIIETPGGDQGLAANSAQSVVDNLAKSPGWADLKAVKAGRVYLNPQGLYPWDRFGPEEALQIQWTAKVLHPDLFTDVDIRSETRNFYQKFFNYHTTEADLDQILQVGSK